MSVYRYICSLLFDINNIIVDYVTINALEYGLVFFFFQFGYGSCLNISDRGRVSGQ